MWLTPDNEVIMHDKSYVPQDGGEGGGWGRRG